METNVNYTLVGAFVIILLAFIVIGIVWLTWGLGMEEYSYYTVYMSEPVSGLSLDEPVEFNGVAVGKIQEIKLNKKNPELVELTLRIKSSTPVTKGTDATLRLRGITGITYISLEDKGTNKQPLSTPSGEAYPVIKTKPSILVRLDTILNQLSSSFKSFSDNFNRITKSVNSLLDQENLRSFKEVLHSSKQVLHSGERTFNKINIQTLPAANQAIQNIDKFTQDLSETVTEIKQNPSVLLRGKEQQPLGPGER